MNLATLAQRLAEAEAAYHALLTGKAVVEVRDANGESVVYQQSNRASLAAYVNDLRRQIGDGAGQSESGPMRVWL